MGVNIRWGTKGQSVFLLQSVSLCRNIIIWDSCVQGNIIYLLCKCILYFQIIRVFFTSWETRALINTFSLTSSILEWVPLGVGKKWQKQRQFTKLLIGPEEKKKNLTPVFRYRQHIVSSDVYTKPDWVQKQIRRSLEETEAQTRQMEGKKKSESESWKKAKTQNMTEITLEPGLGGKTEGIIIVLIFVQRHLCSSL